MPPWVVARCLTDPDRARWYYRQVAWVNARSKRQKIEVNRG